MIQVTASTPSPEIHVRPRAPPLLRIPELDAANPATVTRKVNLTRLAPIGNPIPNLEVVVGAIVEVDNHSLEFNRPALDPKLKGTERPAVVHEDSIVIVPAIYMRLPEHFPSALVASTPLIVATPLRV